MTTKTYKEIPLDEAFEQGLVKAGMEVKCVNDDGWDDIVNGSVYKIINAKEWRILDEAGDSTNIEYYPQDFVLLVEEEGAKPSTFQNMKFRVRDEEHSKQIQEYLFCLRCGCTPWESTVEQTYRPYLFFHQDGTRSFTEDEEYFKKHPYQEYTLTPHTTYTLTPVEKPVFVTIDGEDVAVTKEQLEKIKEVLKN